MSETGIDFSSNVHRGFCRMFSGDTHMNDSIIERVQAEGQEHNSASSDIPPLPCLCRYCFFGTTSFGTHASFPFGECAVYNSLSLVGNDLLKGLHNDTIRDGVTRQLHGDVVHPS